MRILLFQLEVEKRLNDEHSYFDNISFAVMVIFQKEEYHFH